MSQDKPAPGEPGGDMPDMQTMMKKWLATVKPNANHKWLEQFAGKWNTTTKMWMGGPDAPPTETKGTAEMKMVLDGRYLQQEAKGEMLMPDATGQMKPVQYSGMGLTGYDNYRHIYVGHWQDNLSTAMHVFSGQRDPAGKVLTMYGQMDEPMLDMIARHVKYVTTIDSDKKFTFAVYDLAAGDNHKALEIVYERQ
ncbi:MAG: DUF1579 domain-containing protein [Anaerolineae bacterium]|nr:DUF1579 domain-containing protein [Phycisphaerae bacterium]